MKRSILFLSILLLVACERQSRDLAGVKTAPLGSPQYDVVAQAHQVAGVTFIESVAPGAGGGPDGEKLYVANCSACHQVTGQGVPGVFPPLAASTYVTGDNTERLAAIMIYGLMGPINVNGTTYNGVMAPLGHLKDAELAAIATYVRSAWGNTAGAIEEKLIADTRAKYGTRGQFKIAELGEDS